MGARLSIALLLVFAVGDMAACDKTSKELTEVKVPDAGVQLRYDLSPGQAWAGTVKVRNAINTPGGQVVANVKFKVDMMVSGVQDGDAQELKAVVSDIEYSSLLPQGVPAGAMGTQEDAAKLNGMELRFTVNELGEVRDAPEPPEDLPMVLQQMVGLVSGGVTGSVVRLPEEALKSGKTWQAKGGPPRPGVKAETTGTGTFEGLVRDEAGGEELAKLAVQAESKGTITRGSQTMEFTQQTVSTVLFSTSAGYPARIERQVTMDAGGTGLQMEIEADWTKLDKRAVESTEPPAKEGEVQEITDPCDPDYVGAGECTEDAKPAEDAAKPDAKAAAKPAAKPN